MGKNVDKLGFPCKTLARTASFGAWVSLSCLFSVSVSAQSVETNTDIVETPVAARIASDKADTDRLPADLKPEELSAPRVTDINNDARFFDRNSWDPSILTQSTGLSAASSQTASSDDFNTGEQFAEDEFGEGVLASDLLSAEDLLNVGNIQLPGLDTGFAAPPREDGVINLNSALRETLFDSPNGNINASVFKLDLGDRLCLGTAEECEANRIESIDVGYAKNITHGKFDGLNLQLTPRAGLRFDDDSKSALVGALVRVGDNLREGSEMKSNTWYFFAGADAEAVTYTPTGVRRLTSGEFHLQDRIIVGDAQAGLGYRLGSADLALTYYKRQAKAENYSYDEDAAALSLTWRR
ncbi:MAG: DUF2219 family protein [Acidimicrobiales bacterium]|nr:DUF2219 family protein [Hyphomonadaceae bacterium]RZV37810.1 MAG: DUF2219 family protein [Acidimicrobiales bacterium]